MKIGDYLKVRTRTLNQESSFGTCVYEIKKIALPCAVCGGSDGVTVVMRGSGNHNSRSGMQVHDCEKRILKNVEDGLTTIISGASAKRMAIQVWADQTGRPGRTGVLEG